HLQMYPFGDFLLREPTVTTGRTPHCSQAFPPSLRILLPSSRVVSGGNMAFCAQCGTQVEGKFCAKCGTPMDAPAAPPPPAGPPPGSYSAPPPNQPPYQQPYQQPYGAPPPPAAPASAGLEENMACALCYLLWVLTGVL